MARCTSWRYAAGTGHSGHLPGGCRDCWHPCRERVPRRGDRCAACLQALLICPDHRVRRALLQERDVPIEVLQALAQDQYPMIALAAQRMLVER